ncbi:methyltransferase family protein [Novosphingobium cyanobacteriorum]|uniref:Isoprenylcysteine carboxylmethyltransferase family protein n=1 Tax=Novosphingobium cyanobacteriorum TaxID=3024215 RepID=A0ABT6CGG3_9SPHN|nr:isoprenylcysteine carboxylmethyltransferase family protein [Novosphingobium cyanobacteriorum]MDF8332558.1 isoprenylcysteine carboxylmethyltransferase family protein [Novosphingobium cyanobacteriorum]
MSTDPSAAAPRQRPESDVSAAVGLSGLAGLLVWLLVCRNWPAISDALALPGPHERLNGANAALAALLFSGTPMVLWSLLVDKVHRRPSTGIDWDNPRPLRNVMDVSITKIAGLWATWSIIGFVYCLGRWYWRGGYLFAMDILTTIAPLMFLGAIPYVLWLDRVLVNPRDGAWHFGALLIGREPYDIEQVWHHLRAWAVKGFFCAFMIMILPGGFLAMVNMDWSQVPFHPVAIGDATIQFMFMVDVQIAMVGYLLTMKPLDAQIRTANPFLGGWVSALICYPPFILMGDGAVLDYHQNTAEWNVWLQDYTPLLWVWAVLLVVLTGIYAWATVAFGLRFSNLTYRGVLTNGPYAYTRHPAYLSKNTYWWLATMPFLATSGSLVDVVRNTVTLGLVSAVYYWRARTEEKHLLGEDAKYRAYHAWMNEHGLITSRLYRLGRLVTARHRRSAAALQPAE